VKLNEGEETLEGTAQQETRLRCQEERPGSNSVIWRSREKDDREGGDMRSKNRRGDVGPAYKKRCPRKLSQENIGGNGPLI